jgi:hypothetical protein
MSKHPVFGRGVWQGVAMDSLKYRYGLPLPYPSTTCCRFRGGHPVAPLYTPCRVPLVVMTLFFFGSIFSRSFPKLLCLFQILFITNTNPFSSLLSDFFSFFSPPLLAVAYGKGWPWTP